MWTVSDTGQLINFEAVRSVGIEVSDDRQFVYVQVRWMSNGERFAIATLIVREIGDVRAATTVAQRYVDAIKERLNQGGHVFEMPDLVQRSPDELADDE